MRRRIWISLVSLLGVVLLGILSASPLAKRQAHQEAEKRGFVLEMEEFHLGFFDAELRDVKIRLRDVQNIEIEVERMVVEFSLASPRLRRLVAEDGRVKVSGSLDEVRSALSKWRDARPKTKPQATSSNSGERTEILRRFELEWSGAFEPGEKQIISGLNVERDENGVRIGADLIEASRMGLSAQIAGAELKANSAAFDLSRAEELGATEMRITFHASPSDDLAPADSETEGAPTEADAPSKIAAKAKDVPAQAQKSAGIPNENESEPGLQETLEKDSERVKKLRAAISFLRERVTPLLPPKTGVGKLWFTYSRGEEKLHVGPSRLDVEKGKNGFVVEVTPRGSAKGTPLSLALALLPAQNPVAMKLSLEGGPVSLSTLGVEEGAFGLSGVSETQLSGSFTAELNQSVTTIQGGGDIYVEGLTVDSPKLSESIVAFPKLALSGKGQLNIDGSLLRLEEAKLRLGEAGFVGAFEVQGGESFVALKASASAPLVSCQALLDSAPRGLLAQAELMKFDGTFSLDLGVEADTRKLADMKVRWDFKNACRVTAVPAELDPEQFRGLFRREVLGAGGFPVELEFGPLSSSWVPWEDVSPYIEKALLVTEDGRFFRHQGFDDRAIESAIRANVESGHFVRGASTISMQLAKNLYLSRKKNLARKFQEAALTSLLEQNFEKHELLELYVNVVEFGPGIYGIRQAAEYYFSTTPDRLTAAQAFFIASVLPAPTRRYFEEDGTLNSGRADLVRRLLKISRSREALTDSELEEALKEELVFGRAGTLPENAATEETDESKADDEGGKTGGFFRKGSMTAPRTTSESADEPIFPARSSAHD